MAHNFIIAMEYSNHYLRFPTKAIKLFTIQHNSYLDLFAWIMLYFLFFITQRCTRSNITKRYSWKSTTPWCEIPFIFSSPNPNNWPIKRFVKFCWSVARFLFEHPSIYSSIHLSIPFNHLSIQLFIYSSINPIRFEHWFIIYLFIIFSRLKIAVLHWCGPT